MPLDTNGHSDKPDDPAGKAPDTTVLNAHVRPRTAVMTDANGLTAAELRFLRNQRVEEANADSTAKDDIQSAREHPGPRNAENVRPDRPITERDDPSDEPVRRDDRDSHHEESDSSPTPSSDQYRTAIMTDANGLTAAELRFQRNKRIDEAGARSAGYADANRERTDFGTESATSPDGSAPDPDKSAAENSGSGKPDRLGQEVHADPRSQSDRPGTLAATDDNDDPEEASETDMEPRAYAAGAAEVDGFGIEVDTAPGLSAGEPPQEPHSQDSRQADGPTAGLTESHAQAGRAVDTGADHSAVDEIDPARPAPAQPDSSVPDEHDEVRPDPEHGSTGLSELEAELPLEGADRKVDAIDPHATTDYYPTFPPTTYDRYLVRDQQHPIPLFDGPPIREQTKQGSLGDCGIVSTLGAIAGHRPEAIQNCIKEAGAGEYRVTLHEVTPATFSDPVARPTGNTVTYKLSDELPVRSDRSGQPLAGMKAETSSWAALLEKAVAAQDQTWTGTEQAAWDQAWLDYRKAAVDTARTRANLQPSPAKGPSGYNRLDIGSNPFQRADLLAQVTGSEAEVRSIPGESEGEQTLLDEFKDRLSDGKPILVGSRGKIPGEAHPFSRRVFAFSHAYEVVKIEDDKIHVRNPWGSDEYGNSSDPPPMDARTFWNYFRRFQSDGSQAGYYTTLK